MSVLDSKYEIISQETLGDGHTVFDAIAPDGTALRVVWYELDTAAEENRFEQYRQTLRKLRRAGHTALYDIVSRPGAHYVAWRVPNGLAQSAASHDVEAALADNGYTPEMADIRAEKNGKALIFNLAFNPDQTALFPLGPAIPAYTPNHPVKPVLSLPRLSDRLFGWALSAFLLGLAFLMCLWAFRLNSNNTAVILPDLKGLSISEANERLYDLNLRSVPSPVSSSEPLGEVVTTQPEAGTRLRPRYRSVRLDYAVPSAQLSPTIVPDLSNLPPGTSYELALEQASLKPGNVAFIASDKASGTVLAQSREAGSRVSRDTTVHLLLSEKHPNEETFLLNLVGLSTEDASFFTRLAGLNPPEIVEVESAEGSAPTVLSQSVGPFIAIPRDTRLRLYVSSGRSEETLATSVTPSLLGMSLEQAQRMAGAPLALERIDVADLPPGIVSQEPPPGSAPEALIRVVVNTYVPPVDIPLPRVRASIIPAEPRTFTYIWYVEPGIDSTIYRVRATMFDGTEESIGFGVIKGGEYVQGSFTTNTLGPVRLNLFLNDAPYSVELIKN